MTIRNWIATAFIAPLTVGFILMLFKYYIFTDENKKTDSNIAHKQENPSPSNKETNSVRVKRQNNSVSLINLDTKVLGNSNAKVSVSFNSLMGEDFAKLTIFPHDGKPVSLIIYSSGQYIEFKSKSNKYIASVSTVNFSIKSMVVNVSRMN